MIEGNHFKRHSRLGIASTIIGGGLPLLVMALLMLIIFFDKIGHKTETKSLEPLFDVSLGVFSFVGLVAPVLHLIGLVLGIIGAFSKETKKTFPIVGIILNLLFGLIGLGIILLLGLFLKDACCAWR